MRKTNKDKYYELLSVLNVKKNKYISEILGENVPTKIYSATISGIVEYKINKIIVRGKKEPFINKKTITKTDIEKFKNYLPIFDVDEKKIYIDYVQPLANNLMVQCSYELNEIYKNNRFSFNKESLINIQKELAETYSAKDGHSPCRYCGKQIPNDKLIDGEIFCREYKTLVRKKYKYCSTICIGNDQMAQEG